MAFILGLPANEIVLPIALMAYLSSGVLSDYSSIESLKEILVTNGWTIKTALCACIFSVSLSLRHNIIYSIKRNKKH